MRGFLVLFDGQKGRPHDDDALEKRVAEWQRMGGSRVRRLEHPDCRFYLFTAVEAIPAEFNQRLTSTPDEILLWVGPRIDITASEVLKGPESHELPQLEG